MKNIQTSYDKWDRITRKWWFYTAFALWQVVGIFATFALKNPQNEHWSQVIRHTFPNALLWDVKFTFPFIQAVTIAFIVLLLLRKHRFGRIFSIYAGITFILQAVLQNTALTDTYGLTIVTVNVVQFVLVGLFWFWEAGIQNNRYSFRPQTLWMYAAIPLAFFAFWAPESLQDFLGLKLGYILTSGTTYGFCLMVPVYLAILFLSYPQVNLVTLRVTGLVGTMLGLYNMSMVAITSHNWWSAAIHTPLLVLSIIGFILSFRKEPPSIGPV